MLRLFLLLQFLGLFGSLSNLGESSSEDSSGSSSSEDNSDSLKYSISGFSCGARFAHSYLIAHSSEIGTAFIASGAPFLNTSTIYNETTLEELGAYFFETNPTKYEVDDIISWIYYLESQELIDDLSYLLSTQIHIYHASLDDVVSTIHSTNLELLYSTLITDISGGDETAADEIISSDIDNHDFDHFWITPNYGPQCETALDPIMPYLCQNGINTENNFTLANEIFSHIFSSKLNEDKVLYAPATLDEVPLGGEFRVTALGGQLLSINSGNNDVLSQFSNVWDVFVPVSCVLESKMNDFFTLLYTLRNIDGTVNYDILSYLNNDCQLHIVMHGGTMGMTDIGSVFNIFNGLNEWADVNQHIILYPSLQWSLGTLACFDFWGSSGLDYFNKNGKQISLIHTIANDILQAMNE